MQKLSSFKQAYQLIGVTPSDEITPDQKANIIFQAACLLLGLNPLNLPDYSLIEREFCPSNLSQYKLQVIRKAVVGEWADDWNNRGQLKWAPVHWMNGPGFRFYDSYYVVVLTYVTGGSRLCFETEKQSDFVGQDCIAFYRDLYGAAELAPVA